MLKNAIISGLLLGMAHGMVAVPAEAHRRNGGHRHSTVVVAPWFIWQQPQPRVRINEYCVWKPWQNQTVCRY